MAVFWDAHVHIYPHFNLDVFLDAADENFQRAAAGAGLGTEEVIDAVLLLAEAGDINVFDQMSRQAIDGRRDGSWRFLPARESRSLVARNGEGRRLYVVAGRQVISAEDIELLALGCETKFEDRQVSLRELARRVAEHGGAPVLPWGVGKWTGRRGRVVQQFLDTPPDCFHAFGDNGNRPFFGPMPPLLARAQREKRPILSGSDPLPLADHGRRAGSFGGWTRRSEGGGGRLDPDRPSEDLTAIFRDGATLRSFGRGAGLIRFFRDQLRMQARKRFHGFFKREAR